MPGENAHPARGMGLLELLVALAIGSILLLAAIQAFYQAQQNRILAEESSEVQAAARNALFALSEEIAHAGYVDWLQEPSLPSQSLPSLNPAEFAAAERAKRSAYFQALRASVEANPAVLQTNAGTQVGVQTGVLAGAPAESNLWRGPTLPWVAALDSRPPIQGWAQNTGAPVPSTATKQSVRIVYQSPSGRKDCLAQNADNTAYPATLFYIDKPSTDPVNHLYCKGSGNIGGQPLVRGIEELVLRYGVDGQFWNAAEFSSHYSWGQVQSVEICIVVAMPSVQASGNAQIQSHRPTCLRDASGAFALDIARIALDQRRWARYSTTLILENQPYAQR